MSKWRWNFLTVLAVSCVLAMVSSGTVMAQQATVPAVNPTSPATPAENVPTEPSASGPEVIGNIDTKTAPVEDLSTPSLQGSDLGSALDAIPGEIVEDPTFTRELIRVQWRAADPIDLYIIKPKGVKNPPVVLYLYSYPFETDRFLDANFCKFLTKDGVAAVGFASALTGVRYRGRPMKEWFVSELRESLASTAHDVQLILDHLASRKEFDMNRVGMFGDGSGATIAILAAAVDSRIKTLDLLNPWGDWPDWVAKSTRIPEKERANFLQPEWLAKAEPLDPVKWLPQLTTQKIRIQEVNSVTVTPMEARKKIESAAPANAQIVRYDDAQAFLAATQGRGFDWINQQVLGGAAQEYRAKGATQAQGGAQR